MYKKSNTKRNKMKMFCNFVSRMQNGPTEGKTPLKETASTQPKKDCYYMGILVQCFHIYSSFWREPWNLRGFMWNFMVLKYLKLIFNLLMYYTGKHNTSWVIPHWASS